MDRYPWDLALAESRGWNREAHEDALALGEIDDIALTHPTNWLTEEEVEDPDKDPNGHEPAIEEGY